MKGMSVNYDQHGEETVLAMLGRPGYYPAECGFPAECVTEPTLKINACSDGVPAVMPKAGEVASVSSLSA